VPVRVDEAGRHDHARGVEDLRARRVQTRADREDGVVLDQDVGGVEVAEAVVHGEDAAAADDEAGG
jgi:hypothetical protein